jgi:NAD binding domain of 6-phosphogluconate dehydrogenase
MAGMSSGDAGTAVAVIAAGIMGSAMTRNLVAARLSTRVWDRSASATAPLADAGVMFVDAPVSGSKGPAEQGQLLIPGVGSRRGGRRRAPGVRRPRRRTRRCPAAAGRALGPVACRRGGRARTPGHQRRPTGTRQPQRVGDPR